MKFDINEYKGKFAMHCKSKEEAENFYEYMRKYVNRCYSPLWYNTYGKNTAYNLSSIGYSDVNWYRTQGYIILEWEDFMNKEFTKADLEDGMVVEYHDGSRGMVLGDIIMGTVCVSDLCNFTNTLESLIIPKKTIDKVYNSSSYCLVNYFKNDYLTLIWERLKEEPIKEMTVAEIEKELGYKVKIKEE